MFIGIECKLSYPIPYIIEIDPIVFNVSSIYLSQSILLPLGILIAAATFILWLVPYLVWIINCSIICFKYRIRLVMNVLPISILKPHVVLELIHKIGYLFSLITLSLSHPFDVQLVDNESKIVVEHEMFCPFKEIELVVAPWTGICYPISVVATIATTAVWTVYRLNAHCIGSKIILNLWSDHCPYNLSFRSIMAIWTTVGWGGIPWIHHYSFTGSII